MHSTFPSVRQNFNSPSIGMPRWEFFGPRTTLTSGRFFSGIVHSCLSLLPRLHRSLRRAQSLGRWMVAPRLAFIGIPLSHFFSSFFSFLLNLLSKTSMCITYIHLELVPKMHSNSIPYLHTCSRTWTTPLRSSCTLPCT